MVDLHCSASTPLRRLAPRLSSSWITAAFLLVLIFLTCQGFLQKLAVGGRLASGPVSLSQVIRSPAPFPSVAAFVPAPAVLGASVVFVFVPDFQFPFLGSADMVAGREDAWEGTIPVVDDGRRFRTNLCAG